MNLNTFFKSPTAGGPKSKLAKKASPAGSPLFSPKAIVGAKPKKAVPAASFFKAAGAAKAAAPAAAATKKPAPAAATAKKPAPAVAKKPAAAVAAPEPAQEVQAEAPASEAAAAADSADAVPDAVAAAAAAEDAKEAPVAEPVAVEEPAAVEEPGAAAAPAPAAAAAAASPASAAASGAGAGQRDSASLLAEVDEIHAKYSSLDFVAEVEGFGMGLKMANEMRKAGGKVTDSLLGLLVQDSRQPLTQLSEAVFKKLQELAQSEEVQKLEGRAQLPASAAELLDRLPSIADRTAYGDAKADDEESKLWVWETKAAALSKLPKPYLEKVKQTLKASRAERKTDKKRVVLLKSMLKRLENSKHLQNNNNLAKFMADCDKLQELKGDAADKPAGAGGAPALGSLPGSGSNRAEEVPLTEEQAKADAERREKKEAEALRKAALAEELKLKKANEKTKEKEAKAEQKAKEKEAKVETDRIEKERLKAIKLENAETAKGEREKAKVADQEEKVRLKAELKEKAEHEVAAEKERKQLEKERKVEEKLLEKHRKEAEKEAAKVKKQEDKDAQKTRKAEAAAQKEEAERKKQKTQKNAWAKFGFGTKKTVAAAPAPAVVTGPKLKVWKWGEQEAWKLEKVQNNPSSAEFAAATAQAPWAFAASEPLEQVVKGMRERNPKKQRKAGARQVKFLDFRGCPTQLRNPNGHPQEGECVRPPWYGPMPVEKTTSSIITARTPLKMEKEEVVDYDLDSEDEYEGDAEDIENSDGEEDKDEGDDEKDGFVVPDGTFSDEEGVEGDGERLKGISTTSSAKEVIIMTGSSLPKTTIHISMCITVNGPDVFSPYDCDETGTNLLQKEQKLQKLKDKADEQLKKDEEKKKKQVKVEMLPDLARLLHGTTKSKDKIQEEFLELHPGVGKPQFIAKLNEVAKKEKRVELEGANAKNRWWMLPEVLETMGLTDADLPVVDLNTKHFEKRNIEIVF